jgi:hypothetical protein
MSSQTTLYRVTDTYFLSGGINSLAATGASIIFPVLIALGDVATSVGAGGASVVSRALGEANTEKASRTVANALPHENLSPSASYALFSPVLSLALQHLLKRVYQARPSSKLGAWRTTKVAFSWRLRKEKRVPHSSI